jgi:3D (Asp-Asp-Asp) domain-containing protein
MDCSSDKANSNQLTKIKMINKIIRAMFLTGLIGLLAMGIFGEVSRLHAERAYYNYIRVNQPEMIAKAATVEGNVVEAYVTAYTPLETCPNGTCIMASGKDVYVGAIACPRMYEFGTKVLIDEDVYTCEDRTHYRFDGRFDIFMEEYADALNWGKQYKEITIINQGG